jgi:hypothetical protein
MKILKLDVQKTRQITTKLLLPKSKEINESTFLKDMGRLTIVFLPSH